MTDNASRRFELYECFLFLILYFMISFLLYLLYDTSELRLRSAAANQDDMTLLLLLLLMMMMIHIHIFVYKTLAKRNEIPYESRNYKENANHKSSISVFVQHSDEKQ